MHDPEDGTVGLTRNRAGFVRPIVHPFTGHLIFRKTCLHPYNTTGSPKEGETSDPTIRILSQRVTLYFTRSPSSHHGCCPFSGSVRGKGSVGPTGGSTAVPRGGRSL